MKYHADQSSESMRSIRFNKVSPDIIYAIFKTDGSFMTRVMIDFLDLPEQRPKFGRTAAIEMIRTKGNVFTGNQASYLLRNRIDNSPEIKHRPVGQFWIQKRGNYDVVHSYGIDATCLLTYFCFAYFPVCFVVIKVTRRVRKRHVLDTVKTDADSVTLKRKKNQHEDKKVALRVLSGVRC